MAQLEAEVGALETESILSEEERLETESSWESVARNMSYFSRVALESLEGMKTTILPGETALLDERINALLPGIVDKSLRKQLPVIRRFARGLRS